MNDIQRIYLIDDAIELIEKNMKLSDEELDSLTISQIIEYLKNIDNVEAKEIIDEMKNLHEIIKPIAYTMSEHSKIRLFNERNDVILLDNYSGDGVNRIYILNEHETTFEHHCEFLAEIYGEWFISENDLKNEKVAKIEGNFCVYTDTNYNIFFNEINRQLYS